MLATGGIITTLKTDKGIERIHVFNSTDKFRIIYGGKFRILIVGAGENGGTGLGSSADCGQGWRIAARGGGGGGVIDTEIISGGKEMDMIVGSGSGQASSAFGLTAYGGLNGSSGAPTNFTGGQTVVQWCSTRLRQACGAGATGGGSDNAAGQGKSSDITGSVKIYGSGGGRGGQSNDSGQGFLAGVAGGTNAGHGLTPGASVNMNAVANTGSGGGGGAMFGDGGVSTGGIGAAGIIIVRYQLGGGSLLIGD